MVNRITVMLERNDCGSKALHDSPSSSSPETNVFRFLLFDNIQLKDRQCGII